MPECTVGQEYGPASIAKPIPNGDGETGHQAPQNTELRNAEKFTNAKIEAIED